jgi:phosphoribosylaminoimidazole carboxylase PurE protein
MAEKAPLVGIVIGSASDWPSIEPAAALLTEWGIGVEVSVASAHRSPRLAQTYAREAAARGLKIIIAAAGMAAHLAGVIAAEATLPVIAVPIPSSSLVGFDSLLSTVQMPAGVPVATMALGSAGAHNAALFAAEILGLIDPGLQEKLKQHKLDLEAKVIAQNEKIPPNYRPKV